MFDTGNIEFYVAENPSPTPAVTRQIFDLFGQLHPDGDGDSRLLTDWLKDGNVKKGNSLIIASGVTTAEIIGMVSITRAGEESGLLHSLVVDIAERRKGVGEALVRYGLLTGDEWGLLKMTSVVPEGELGKPAQRLLTRVGFAGPDAQGTMSYGS